MPVGGAREILPLMVALTDAGHHRPIGAVGAPRVMDMIRQVPFNKPFIVGRELDYIREAVERGNISGDGHFTKACCELLEQRFGISKVLLTPSCTAALEMAAMLYRVGPGDEVVLPSFTFVSTANAFVQRGARPVFVDIRPDTLNIDEAKLESAVTSRTKLIVPIHYAGAAAEMDPIMQIAARHGLPVIEDAAQGVHSFYRDRAMGSIGQLGAFSFHSTKNYICGEGGALCINDETLIDRAEILRDKGTDRSKFLRGEVDRYTWVDVGSSYVPSEIGAAFLYAQLEMLDPIAERRRGIYAFYEQQLRSLADRGLMRLPVVPGHCRSNYHMFYIVLADAAKRDALMAHLKSRGVGAVFHYLPLHTSPMGAKLGYRSGDLPVTEDMAGRLLRLPFYYEITQDDQRYVVEQIGAYFSD